MKRIYCFTLILFVMITPTFSQSAEKTYILVHGAWYGGGWCWYKVVPLLEAKGYQVLAIDLPGYGNETILASTVTLDDYVQKVIATAHSVKGKVVLVGHSMAGAAISQASELLGLEKVEKLVYLDAFLLRNGESVFSQVEKINATIQASSEAPLIPAAAENLIFSDDKKACLWNPLTMQEFFCHDCSAEDVASVKTHLRWQPLSALATPITVSEARYGSIPKVYILCTAAKDLDKRSIVQNMLCQKVFELSSSHSPFFSMPEKLVAILEEVY